MYVQGKQAKRNDKDKLAIEHVKGIKTKRLENTIASNRFYHHVFLYIITGEI